MKGYKWTVYYSFKNAPKKRVKTKVEHIMNNTKKRNKIYLAQKI
jgi:hypothetical protein